MNSRQKGCRGEREAAAELVRLGFGPARRGQQYSGVEGEDVVHSIPGVHIEVKRTETFSVYAALEQAERDGSENVPIVLHKRNRKPWIVVLQLEDLHALARMVLKTSASVAPVGDPAEQS